MDVDPVMAMAAQRAAQRASSAVARSGKRPRAEESGESAASSMSKRAHLGSSAAAIGTLQFKCAALPLRVRRSRAAESSSPGVVKRNRDCGAAAPRGSAAEVTTATSVERHTSKRTRTEEWATTSALSAADAARVADPGRRGASSGAG